MERISSYIFITLFCIYVFVVYHYASFMPIQDDYSAALGFLELYEKTEGWQEKLKLFFVPNADHRIVLPMLVEWLTYRLSGHLDFRLLIVIGNLGWVATFLLLWYHLRSRIATTWEIIPVVILFFSFAHASLMTWSLGSLQQYWQIFFALFAVYTLTRQHLISSYLSMTAAIFTGGGGFTLVPIFILYNIVYRQWRRLMVTLFVVTAIVTVYFILLPYQFNVHNFSNLSFVDFLQWCVGYFLVFIGSVTGIKWLSFLLGLTTVIFVLLRLTRIIQRDVFIGWGMVFVLLTALLTTQARCTNGIDQALASRYTIYSIIWIVLCYGYGLQVIRERTHFFATIFTFAVGVYGFHLYDKLPRFEMRKTTAEVKLDFFLTSFAEKRLQAAYRNGYFTQWKTSILLPSEALHLPITPAEISCHLHLTDRLTIDTALDRNTTMEVLTQIPFRLHVTGECRIDRSIHPHALIVWIDNYRQLYLLHHTGVLSKSMLYRIDADMAFPALAGGHHTLHIGIVDRKQKHINEVTSIKIHSLPLKSLKRIVPRKGDTMGNIDEAVIMKQDVKIIGWAAMKTKGYIPIIRIGKNFFTVHYGQKRADVASTLHNRHLLFSGFEWVSPNKENFKPDDRIELYILSPDHQYLYPVDKSLLRNKEIAQISN